LLDVLIRGGLIVDGTGNAPYRADVGIVSGRVAAVGRLDEAGAATVIDADGKAVSPGFIDMHSHSDLSLPGHPRASSSLLQGITTEVAGSCGWSLAPLKAETARSVLKRLTGALLGTVPPQIQVGDDDGDGPDPAWHSLGEYLDFLGSRGIGTNLYPVVGQSIIRAHVVGLERRRASAGEIEAMKALLESCLDEGARGLSTGRSYFPGAGAPTEEIIALARVLARRDGIYTSHIKDEGSDLIDAVAEAIRIGRESGVRVQISHHKAVGPANFGKVAETLAMMDEARGEGIDVTCDVYPYDFAQVFSLLGQLPGIEPGLSDAEATKLLASRDFRERAAGELARSIAVGRHPPGFISSAVSYRVVAAGGDRSLEGKTLAEVFGIGRSPSDSALFAGTESGRTASGSASDRTAPAGAAPAAPVDAGRLRGLVDRAADLLLEHELRIDLAAVMCPDDVAAVLGHPQTMVGTDAFTLDRPLDGRTPIHPRHYGTFPRVLGYYRAKGVTGNLAATVHKLTGMPARKLRLVDRGLLARGMWADVVVFDPEKTADRATVTDPYLAPEGIEWVLVNGRVAVAHGAVTETKAGVVLRR